jgi:trigger factor
MFCLFAGGMAMGLISAQKTDTNTMELHISVDAAAFKAAVDRAFHNKAAQITLPGFRKGKAPRSLIEKTYGKGFFYEDAINALYPEAYAAAVDEAQVDPVDRADIDILTADDDGFTFKATCTIKPEVELARYKGIEASKTVKAVTETDIEAELDKLRKRNASSVTVDDRGALKGDTAKIVFEGFVDGVAFEGGKGEDYPLNIGSGTFIPGFEDQIVGHKSGESFEVHVTFPEDYNAEALKGKAAVFQVKLRELRTQKLPELDDEFAKDVSEFDTLEAFKADIIKRLESANESAAAAEFENQLMNTVVEGMTAQIPPVMIENRIDEMVRDFEYRLNAQGMNLEQFVQYTGGDMGEFRASFMPQAQHQVKVRLALENCLSGKHRFYRRGVGGGIPAAGRALSGFRG